MIHGRIPVSSAMMNDEQDHQHDAHQHRERERDGQEDDAVR